LLINADLVTLDLAGFTITGSGTGTAIQFTGPTPQVARHGFAVRNGTISGFFTAVQFIRVGGRRTLSKGDRFRYVLRHRVAARTSVAIGLDLRKQPPSRPKSSSHWTLRWREMDSNLYGAFPVKSCFWFVAGSLFEAGKPFFVPSPAIRFAERAEGVKGPKR
jgi:hypothetical protein